MTEDRDGAVLFEAGLAVTNDLTAVTVRVDSLDPDGVVPVHLWLPDDVTSLARELGRRLPEPEVLVESIVDGYRDRLALDVQEMALGDLDAGDVGPVRSVAPGAGAARGEVTTMLGVLRAHVRVDDGCRIGSVHLSGDVIAPEETVDAIETSLVGLATQRAEITNGLRHTMDGKERWMLGADPVRDVAEAVLRAAGR
jgi:hypothetical protein